MNSFWNLFDDTSYEKKIRLFFYSIFTIITVILLLLGIFLVNSMTEGIYKRNQEKLSLLTYSMKNELDQAQTLTTEIGQNQLIQKSLEEAQEKKLSEIERTFLATSVQNELNWLQVNKLSIKNTLLYDANFQQIAGNMMNVDVKYQNDFDMRVIKALGLEDTEGLWHFEPDMSEAIYVRHLFGTRDTPIKRNGSLILYINLTFVQELLASSDIFSKNDFVVLETKGQSTSTNEKLAELVRKHEQKAENLNEHFKDVYGFQTIGENRFYKLKKEFQVGNQELSVTYYLQNREMIGDVIQIIISYYFVVLIVLFFSFIFFRQLTRRLVHPINLLADNMTNFSQEQNFNEIIKHLNLTRKDEIGQLNRNFDRLVNEIQELITKEYQAKILSQEMEYRFLQAQLNPHFMYNTLNSINWLAIKNKDKDTSMMVTSLAILLRSKLNLEKDYHTVREEMAIVEAYLTIQKVRFKSRLIFHSDIDRRTYQFLIPKLIIQPLIENAIKYGLEKQEEAIHIELMITEQEDQFQIVVSDDGPGFQENSSHHQSTGIGLENISTRLKLLYQGEASLTISSVPHLQTAITIKINKEVLESEN